MRINNRSTTSANLFRSSTNCGRKMAINRTQKRSAFFALGFLFLIGVFLTIGFAYYLVSPARKGGEDQVFFVREGATLKKVGDALERKGIITNKRLFLIWAEFKGYGTQIKAGEYRLNPHMSPLEIMNILRKGAIITHPVTIPEGFTITQIGELLAEKGLVDKDKFLSLTADPEIAGRYGISGPGLEGYIYPDTYRFGRGLSPLSIIDVMVGRFREVFAPFRERAEQAGMSMEAVTTLASIVEKETGLAKERPVIASVFLNRLKKGMRLESDPTVIYGIKGFRGNLKKKDLSEPTPYNTYVIRGLPPGPIANPGREAIEAVLYPAETEYLYFVSKNDGSHHFSKTLSEHNRAVRTYQKNRRTRVKRTP